jgi:hypothetical protein
LDAGTLYYVRAYATNSEGTGYGNQVTFTTTAADVAPTVVMIGMDVIGTTSASVDANVTSDGGSAITERGFVWSLSSGPTTANNKIIVAGTTGIYNGTLTGLTPSTTYYVRPHAINAIGTSYGAQETFNTLPLPAKQVYLSVVSQTGSDCSQFSQRCLCVCTCDMVAGECYNLHIRGAMGMSPDQAADGYSYATWWIARNYSQIDCCCLSGSMCEDPVGGVCQYCLTNITCDDSIIIYNDAYTASFSTGNVRSQTCIQTVGLVSGSFTIGYPSIVCTYTC